MQPTISVIMPVYNAERYLDDAIQSILNQTYEDFEFIIINDCSTDNSYNIIKKYEKKDKRIITINNWKNLGITRSLNKGLKRSSGQHIARMDADDISMINRLEEQIKKMKHYDVVGSDIIIINEDNEQIGHRDYEQNIDNIIKIKSPLAHPVVMFNKLLIDKRGYNENMCSAQDYELWVYFYLQGARITNIKLPLLKYRMHTKANKNKNTKQTIRDTIKVKNIMKQKRIIFGLSGEVRLLLERVLLLLPSWLIIKLFYFIEVKK